MRNLLILIVAAALLFPLAAAAQGVPPIPRPRPADRTPTMIVQTNTQPGGTTALEATTDALQTTEQTTGALATASGPPQPVTLSAKISEEGAIIPNGVVWRVFDTRTDETGQLALLAKSEDSVAVFSLSPGDYVVHVAYGRSQATDTIRVEPGPNSRTLVLDSGALQLNAAITGDIEISPAELRFEIYATGETDQDQVLVAENVRPSDIIHLNAGVYHVISYYGTINAQVRADLRVEPGQLTEATLYHRASAVGFKLVSEEGGEAIADVDWTIQDSSGDTVYTNFGAFPSTILAEGDYTILAKRGSNVYNRQFQVQAGGPREIEVLTAVY